MKKNTVKQPITSGTAKVPVIMQLEELECGAASLCMVLAYYNKWIPLEEVRATCGVSRDGVSAGSIMRAARYYGLYALGYKCNAHTFFQNVTFPCIAFVHGYHFVVVTGAKNHKIYVNDPAKGNMIYTEKEFDQIFNHIIMQFSPSDTFVPSGKPKNIFTFAKKRLKNTGVAITFALATSLIASLLKLLSPAFSRVFIDYLLPGNHPEWVLPFIVLLSTILFIQIVLVTLESIYSLRISGKMAVIGNSTFMWKILKMPMEFFSQRRAGDIEQRQASNATIATSLINTFAPLVLNIIMMLFYLCIMLKYSWTLTCIGLGSMLVNAFITRYITKKRINITRVSLKEQAALSSTTITGIDMIESLKATGAELGFFHKWSSIQARFNASQIKYAKTDVYLSMIPQFITSFTSYAILILGVCEIMNGNFTIGKLMAFQGFLSSFMTPTLSLIDSHRTLQEMRTNMERIDDVMDYHDEDIFSTKKEHTYNKLTGKIEIKNLVFGYNKLSTPIIEDFNLSIEPGESIAIVGDSGCGKSTLSKLLSGIYEPWSGEILFDDKPLKDIYKGVFRSSLAIVDQDITLFEDTIAENIRMWDLNINEASIIEASTDARFHDDVMHKPHAYRYKLKEDGRDLSGGQRQKLELARALVINPSILILDEATSALDAENEYEILQAIKKRNITCIMIAHRLSTIRSCDKIIVLEKGKIMGQGTHEELLKTNDLYQRLVHEA